MARGSNQKLKLLALLEIFRQQTDDEHGLTVQEIAARLEQYDISADRKTLYQDFEELRRFGVDILSEQDGRSTRYHLGEREFELPELKLLVDSIQAAKFITEKKSGELIRKLSRLTSEQQAQHLRRHVVTAGRVKAANEAIYYNVDRIYEAINADRQIRFQYMQWNLKMELEPRHGGAWYQVSPWLMIWDDEYYYLAAFDAAHGQIRHYRVDKMKQIQMLDGARDGRTQFEQIDPAHYSNSLFGMFAGSPVLVTLEAEPNMIGVLVDRFGRGLMPVLTDEGRVRVHVRVTVSSAFYGWILGLGGGVRIVGPQDVVDGMRALAQRFV